MDNDTNTTIDVETTYLDASTEGMNAFFAGLADAGQPDTTTPEPQTDTTQCEADQPAAESKTQAEKATHADAGREYPIRYKGKDEVLFLTDEEVITELQKARNYADVRKERDELRKGAGELAELKGVVAMFAERNGVPYDEFFEECKAESSESGVIAEVEREYPEIPHAAAVEIAKKRIAERDKARAEEKNKADAEQLAADIAELKTAFPNADIDHLPDAVQAMIGRGVTPVDAMYVHDAKELRKANAELTAKIQALEKENTNRQKAPQRLDNADSDGGLSPFMRGFLGGG